MRPFGTAKKTTCSSLSFWFGPANPYQNQRSVGVGNPERTLASRRWTVEECLEAAKGEVGLDHCEVRHNHAWYRRISLAMLALAYVAVVRSRLPGATRKGRRWSRNWPLMAS
jgi:hypothetical protein